MPAVAARDAQAPLVLVLDAGSSSLRGSVYDARARPVAGWEARETHRLHPTAGHGVEEDAEEVTARIAAVIDRVLAGMGTRAGELRAVGMASYAATLVGVDEAGAAVTPIYPYADSRPAAEVRELRGRLDELAVHQRTGCRLHTSYLPARLLWLSHTEPAVYRRARRWMSLPEYLFARLLGLAQCSYSIASWTGLLNRATLAWDAQWLETLDLDPASLSPVNDAPLMGLTPEYARRWPALAEIPWFPGYADGATSNIGSGCTTPDAAALSIGTSGAMRLVTGSPSQTLSPALWCYRVDRSRALLGGALNEGGGVVAWARDVFRLPDIDAAEERIAAAEPDGHGLTVLPFLTGERSPGWNPDIRAAVAGIGLQTGPVEVLQALMEAVAYRFGLIWRELEAASPGVERLVASGGGAVQSPVWLQMLADVLGHPVSLSAESEATSRGVAVLVLEALGRGAAIPPAETARTFHPDAARHARYAAAMERQQALYDLIAEWGRG